MRSAGWRLWYLFLTDCILAAAPSSEAFSVRVHGSRKKKNHHSAAHVAHRRGLLVKASKAAPLNAIAEAASTSAENMV